MSANGNAFGAIFEHHVTSWLVAIISVSFIVRLYISFIGDPFLYSGDSYSYVREAEAILAGNWSTRLPKGYPFIIAVFSVIFGDLRDPALIVLNAVMWSGSAVIAFYLVRHRTGGEAWALLAALIVSFWPTHFIWTRSIMSEIPAAFLLASGTALIWFRHHVCGALAIGFCVIVRPSLLPAVPLMSAVLLFRDGWKRAAMVLIVAILPQVAVSLIGSAKSPDYHSSHTAEAILLSDVHRKDRSTFVYKGESTGEAVEKYLNNVISDPVRYFSLRAHFLNMLWGPWPERNLGLGGKGPTSVKNNLLIGLQFPLIMLALLSFFYRRDLFGLFLLCPALALTVVHVLLFSTSRYNMTVIPLVSVLAADGLFILYAIVVRRSGRGAT